MTGFILKAFGVVLGTYLVTWTFWFVVLGGGSPDSFLYYFFLGFTGGGEIPTFIHLFAAASTLVLAVPVLIVKFILKLRGGRRFNQAPDRESGKS
jgi:hypothetical protein